MRWRVASVAPETTIQAAASLMREQGCGLLPVVDANGKVVGVLTDRDIVIRVCASGAAHERTAVSSAMSHEVVFCSPDDSLDTAEELMIGQQKQRVLVLEAGKLAGILSLTDIAQAEQPLKLARLVQKITARELRLEHA